MHTAPKDGNIIELRHVSKEWGELTFRARWLDTCKVWVNWDRQHVSLDEEPLVGWQPSGLDLRQWNEEELAILTELHGPNTTRYLDADALSRGERVLV